MKPEVFVACSSMSDCQMTIKIHKMSLWQMLPNEYCIKAWKYLVPFGLVLQNICQKFGAKVVLCTYNY
jgi:hypothetical protein